MHETLVSMDHGTLPSADCRSELKHWPTGGRGSAPGSDFPALHMSVVCKGRTLGERTTEIFSETSVSYTKCCVLVRYQRSTMVTLTTSVHVTYCIPHFPTRSCVHGTASLTYLYTKYLLT
jgi:hypothetical protein